MDVSGTAVETKFDILVALDAQGLGAGAAGQKQAADGEQMLVQEPTVCGFDLAERALVKESRHGVSMGGAE